MAIPDSQSFDVAVVGAGPAGCSAALALARSGAQVVLLEKAVLPRHKTCGGGLVHNARQLLPGGAARAIEREFHSVELNFAGTGLNFVTSRSEPMLSLARRAELDYALSCEAKATGARVMEVSPVGCLTMQADSVEITAGSSVVRARFVVAADGAQGSVARLAGWPRLPQVAPAIECEIRLDDRDFARLGGTARFDFDVTAHGYGWVFPKRDHLSIGVLSMRRGGANLNMALQDYLRLLGLGPVVRGNQHGGLIPVAPRSGPLARGRILLTGDAAGLVDPVTAEGISHALLSGRLAAQAIVECAPDPAQVASRYQSLVEAQILGELRAGRFLARLLYDWPRLRKRVVRRSGQKLAEFMADVITGHATYLGALRRPASYLKALGFGD